MKKIVSLVAVSLVFVFVSTSVAAEGGPLSGLYGSASFGSTKADIDEIAGANIDDTDTGYSIGLGYEFNKYVSFEIGYIDLGKATVDASASSSGTINGKPITFVGTLNAKVEADGFYYGPKLSYPVTEQFDIFAKAGLFSWDADAEAIASGNLTYNGIVYAGSVTATASDDGTDFYGGLGLSYDLTDMVTLEAEWTRYTDVADSDVDFIGAGLVFKFGKLF